jgi:hypothetical protein
MNEHLLRLFHFYCFVGASLSFEKYFAVLPVVGIPLFLTGPKSDGANPQKSGRMGTTKGKCRNFWEEKQGEWSR